MLRVPLPLSTSLSDSQSGLGRRLAVGENPFSKLSADVMRRALGPLERMLAVK
jgi:hypothetical protein